MKHFSVFRQIWVALLFLATFNDAYAQKEGTPNFAFSVSEQIIDCKLQLTITAQGSTNCEHEWNLGSCGSNQIKIGNQVTFFISNVNTYLNTPIIVDHKITCNGVVSGLSQPYSINTQGIFIGKPEDYSAVFSASGLIGCNNGIALLSGMESQKNIYVSSSIQFNNNVQHFDNVDICMDPGTSLIVGTGNTFMPNLVQFANGSKIHNGINGTSQSAIWKGIEVKNDGTLEMYNTTVKGALVGINLKNNAQARIRLQNSTFDRNYIGLAANSNFVNLGIIGNVFKGIASASQNVPDFSGVSLDPYLTNAVNGLVYSASKPMFSGILLVGSILDISKTNTFEVMANGIFLKDCSSKIEKCVFKNLSVVTGTGYSLWTGYGIIFMNTRDSNTPTYRNIDQLNEFTGCQNAGIYLNNYAYTYFNSAGFRTIGTMNGYKLDLQNALIKDPTIQNVIKPSSISNANILCKKYGIQAIGVSSAAVVNYLNIYSNEFFVANNNNININKGIEIENVYTNNNNITVQNNSFYAQDGVTSVASIYYVHLKNMKEALVSNNIMSTGGLTTGGTGNSSNVYGVVVQGGQSNKLECNSMVGSVSLPSGSGEQQIEDASYWVDNSPLSELAFNRSSYTTHGIRFTGPCLTNNSYAIRFNTMYRNAYSLSYDANAITGPQNYGGTDGNGNIWLQQSAGFIGARHAGTAPIVNFSPFLVPPSSLNDPKSQRPFEFKLNPGVFPDDWFDVSGEPNEAQDPCVDNVALNDNPRITDLDRKIAGGQFILDTTTPDGYYWLYKDYLYRKSLDNPAIADTISVIQNFITANQNQAIGKLYGVKQGIKNLYALSSDAQQNIANLSNTIHLRLIDISIIDSILLDSTLGAEQKEQWIGTRYNKSLEFEHLQDSLNTILLFAYQGTTQSAAALLLQNNAISSNIAAEENQRFVNKIFIEKIILKDTISTSELDQLFKIAERCPTFGGWAVYEARSLYTWFTGQEVEETPCVPGNDERSTPFLNAASSAVTMFPNPAAQTLFIQSAQNEQGHEFILTNLLGQIVLTRSLDGNQTEISISHLKPGVY